MYLKLTVIFAFVLIFSSKSYAQEPSKWSVHPAFEVNYTGYNTLLNLAYLAKDKHLLEAGVSYNLSDGFANNPTIGLSLAYGYKILNKEKWSATIGIDYRRQKPLEIVNIQTLCYANTITYRATESLSIHTRLGYGVAAERARSAGSFSQSNNITGLFQIGCGYHL